MVNSTLIDPVSKIVVSNTGPLISALQSQCLYLLQQFYARLCIPSRILAEFQEHGAAEEIRIQIKTRFITTHELTTPEQETAWQIAAEIARSPRSRRKDSSRHYPEAEAIVLMMRAELGAVELLLDELAAREVAHRRGIALIGFPGILIRACQQRIMTPEQVRDALLDCQRQGTHYAHQFITAIYERLRRNEHGNTVSAP